jgi:FtsP/CotA-like multicopper oxidase with cupredoxin domain
MSDREKKLLALFLIAGFLIVNFFLYSLYVEKKSLYASDLESAKSQLQQAITFRESSSEFAEQMTWLAENEPAPATYEETQSALELFAVTQAQNLGLNVKSREPLPTDETGIHFHRAQVKINLSGQEKALYQWFDAINDPEVFRTAYQIRMSPNTQDDTLIDCSATVSQWFPPAL